MNRSRAAHDRAMDLAFLADRSKAAGSPLEARRLYKEALEEELEALSALQDPTPVTSAVMHRSAAWLAVECGETRRAEQLASAGLAGDPPSEIADELRHVWEQANLQLHLHAQGVSLAPEEVEMTLSGRAVGWGITEWAGYRTRVDHILRLITRITERMAERPFRQAQPPDSAIRKHLIPHISLARAASYSVSIRLGTGQQNIPGAVRLPELSSVIDNFLTIVETVNDSREEKLEDLIRDDDYRRNALALTRQIAPDGTRIRQVGFATSGSDGPRMVGLTRTKKSFRRAVEDRTATPERMVTLQGTLLFADARRANNTIRVVADGRDHTIKVEPSLMDDIVRPLWNSEVSVQGIRRGRSIELRDIDPA